ncbi:hypothetical protein A2755_01460 [Candidatus Wolfebacteria bacterium RIFCSPHIGHO2_01_FULL_48_22]|uniref:Thioredoxin domain-containing protein n=2 Tax=Candidatus Wolfeibacteriota TaxID=1752735 RepID=A0A1F8DWI8_9BACT|nr:MAG: hypothetical protein A2755_01460 [Candidatus Wolfebacteria bacterium RIFCSPHIGHO2_01_FULL_48_22]OGM93888.1 MAG: hypothetical protein A2935_03325 [Candidatus Wolfebacteria bacterium RIFCSPLOWO2_01_FULL_47_17b]
MNTLSFEAVWRSGFFLLLLLITLAAPFAYAGDPPEIYFFYGEGCPHCAKEKIYLQTVEERFPDVRVNRFEVYYNHDNAQLFQDAAKKLGVTSGAVPFTVIGDKTFIGFSEEISPPEMDARIQECVASTCPDSLAPDPSPVPSVPTQGTISIPEKYKDYSLPALAVVLGILDGFNPCAMWALLFLISLLLGMKDRKRMWIFGSAFIVASAAVYFVFMAAWLNLVLLLGVVLWIRLLIGLLALFGGGYSLRKFFTTKEATCEVTGAEKRKKIFDRLKESVQQNSFWLALGGIILLALAVNLVELICSAGLPAVFTQVLAMNDLASWQYYGYILLYILFFMLDDLFVFFAAMLTLHLTGITTKYTRWSRLIGGLLMLAIGLLLIFKPSWLMFG